VRIAIHDLFERGVAGTLAEPVDRALDLAWRRSRRRRASFATARPEIVVAVRRDDEIALHGVDDELDQPAVVVRHGEADGVGDVERRRAVVDRDLAHLAHEVGIGAVPVLGRELDVVDVTLGARATDTSASCFTCSGVHAELLLHVDLSTSR